jgi:hypothetical protein
MTPTIASTLSALSDVGSIPVTVRLNPHLFPVAIAQDAAARQAAALSVDSAGDLTVSAASPDAWHALREFTRDLLAHALRAE